MQGLPSPLSPLSRRRVAISLQAPDNDDTIQEHNSTEELSLAAFSAYF